MSCISARRVKRFRTVWRFFKKEEMVWEILGYQKDEDGKYQLHESYVYRDKDKAVAAINILGAQLKLTERRLLS